MAYVLTTFRSGKARGEGRQVATTGIFGGRWSPAIAWG
jgi:hypothetical protein